MPPTATPGTPCSPPTRTPPCNCVREPFLSRCPQPDRPLQSGIADLLPRVTRVLRSLWLLRLGAVVLATCALATACRGSASGRTESVRIHGNSLVLIDARSAKVVADVPVGRDSTRIAYGQRAFWVVSPDAGTVVRVGVDSKAATRFHIGNAPYDVAIGAGAVWIPDHDGRRLLRFDLESHALRERDFGLPAISVGFGFRSVWLVLADGSLRRIDPRTLREERSIPEVTTAIEGSEPKPNPTEIAGRPRSRVSRTA